MFQQGTQARIISVKKVNKFKFTDYQLAEYVRGKMLQTLTAFDANKDLLFQKQQIAHAFQTILGEDPTEMEYVLRNVSRYDKDNDGSITYKQFVDFSVEQHFGEMAIQRLHKTKLYSQGSKRIMNLQEFIKTLEYSLNKIGIFANAQTYSLLFNSVDLDRDSFISYEDYFHFLKEYFGTLSVIYDKEPTKPEPLKPSGPDFKVDEHAVQRFARLIYNQMRMTVIKSDKSRKLHLSNSDIENMFGQILQLNEQDRNYLTNLALQGKEIVSYEAFLSFFVPFYFCEYFINVSGLAGQVISRDVFIYYLTQASLAIVNVPPTENTLASIFYIVTKHEKDLSVQQFSQLMSQIFQGFHFDSRGLRRP